MGSGALGEETAVISPLQRRQNMSTAAVKRKMTAMERKENQGGLGRWSLGASLFVRGDIRGPWLGDSQPGGGGLETHKTISEC